MEAKSVCTNQVLGQWKLTQEITTDTIFCYNKDDVILQFKKLKLDNNINLSFFSNKEAFSF
jgi:hypothetical protein